MLNGAHRLNTAEEMIYRGGPLKSWVAWRESESLLSAGAALRSFVLLRRWQFVGEV